MQQSQSLSSLHTPLTIPPPPPPPRATTTTTTTTGATDSHPQHDWTSMTRTVAHYERYEQIGEGTYGQVYRARCRDSGRIVALKKMRIHHGGYWGMPLQLIREIKILKRLVHPCLLRMHEVITSKGVEHLDENDPITSSSSSSKKDKATDNREGYKGNLFLVLEYVAHDLTGLLDVAYQFDEVQIKCIFRQLLEALQYMHQHKYVHRDIKSSNILLTQNFELKLADFGLARSVEPPILDQMNLSGGNKQMEFTNKVITLWYRPPEILVGSVIYNGAVDVWSAGCILAELITGKPLFPGKTEMDQLHMIVELLGTPNQETWNYLQGLKKGKPASSSSSSNTSATGFATIDMPMHPRPSRLRTKFSSKMSPTALNLLEKLLEWDPRKRLTAANALDNRYFWTQPTAPANPAELGELQVGPGGHFHEFQTKKKRREAKAISEEARQAAKLKGASDDQAQDKFDAVYLKLMKKVAKEGLHPLVKKGGDSKHEAGDNVGNGDTARDRGGDDDDKKMSSSGRRHEGSDEKKKRKEARRESEGSRREDRELSSKRDKSRDGKGGDSKGKESRREDRGVRDESRREDRERGMRDGREDRGVREGRRDEPRKDGRRRDDREKEKRSRRDDDERKRSRDGDDEERQKRHRRNDEGGRDQQPRNEDRGEKESGEPERPKDSGGSDRKRSSHKHKEHRGKDHKKRRPSKSRGHDGRDRNSRDKDDHRGSSKGGDRRRPSSRDRDVEQKADTKDRVGTDRGSPREDRGPPLDDRRPPRDDHGPPRDDRGPPRDDRGPPRDDRGPFREDRGPARDDRGPPRDDRGRGRPRDDRGPPPSDRGMSHYGPGPYGPQPPGRRDGPGPPQDRGHYGRDERGPEREPFRGDGHSHYGPPPPNRRGRGRR